MTSYKEVFSKELIIGAAARGDTTYDLPMAQNNILGTHFKLVSEYSGNNEILLAMDKNEVQGICGSGVPSMMAQENADGSQKLDEQGIPRSPDFAKTDEDRKVLDLIYVP